MENTEINNNSAPAAPTEPVSIPEKPKKKNLLFLVIGAIAILVIVAAIVIVAVIANNSSAPAQTTTTTPELSDEEKEKIKAEVDAENAAIIADMNSLVVSLNNFQTNNNGKIPGNWATFFRKYASDITKKYKYDTCDYSDEGNCKSIEYINWNDDKYLIHIATYASCKKNSYMNHEDSVRRIAFYTVLRDYEEKSEPYFFCTGNEAWPTEE